MSSFNLLNLGNQALRTNQAALSTVGQNISNVNTPGYSRQIANFATLEDQSGVLVESIDRMTNQFLTEQLWSDLSSYNQTSTFTELSKQLDNLLATQNSSVSAALDNYFSALQNVVDDPVSIPNRELFVAESEALAKRFNNLDTYIQRQNNTVNESLEAYASQVNALSKNIAQLNANINVDVAANKPANELKDQRDELTNQLSELIGITVLEQQNSESYSIFIGNGEPLVMGISANQFVLVEGDPDISQLNVSLQMANSAVDVTNLLNGGKIGGLLEYRTGALNTSRDELGRIAIGFAESMNTAHRTGIDLNSELGGNLFRDVNTYAQQTERIAAGFDNRSNVSVATVEIQDTTKLQASDYELFYGSDNEITLTRKSDGKRIDINLLADAVDNRSVAANPLAWGGNIAPSTTPAVSETLTPTLNGVAGAAVAVDSAQAMASMLNGLVGVSGVTAESAINISAISDPGADGVSFDLTLNDALGAAHTVSVSLAAGVFSDGNIASAINAALDADGNDFSHLAVSTPTGGGVKLVDSTGGNLSVGNTGGAGDSISIQNYSAAGSLSSTTVIASGVTGSAVGYLKNNTATINSSVGSLSLSSTGSALFGATSTVLVDISNNVESTRADKALGVKDVDSGEFYVDPAGRSLSFAIDGIKVSIETSNKLAKGDRFLIQPVRHGAENLALVVKDGRQLALASPVRVSADTDNQGAAKASVTMLDSIASAFNASGELKPPVDIVFNNSDPLTFTAYDMSEPFNPTVLAVDNVPLLKQAYTEGSDIGLLGYNVTITGQPKAGDRFSFVFNKDGVSDNRNALMLSDLQQKSTLDGGSYQDLYGSLIERVGTRTATSAITLQANKAVLDSTVMAKSSVAGVNLDEEAAKLVQFQQAYQASAQLIKTSQTLFDTLLNSM